MITTSHKSFTVPTNGRPMTVTFFPQNPLVSRDSPGRKNPYVKFDFGMETREMDVRDFVREFTPIMLEAFELSGGPFAL